MRYPKLLQGHLAGKLLLNSQFEWSTGRKLAEEKHIILRQAFRGKRIRASYQPRQTNKKTTFSHQRDEEKRESKPREVSNIKCCRYLQIKTNERLSGHQSILRNKDSKGEDENLSQFLELEDKKSKHMWESVLYSLGT